MKVMKIALLTCLLGLSATATAQTPPAAVAREVGQLFSALQTSGCTFSRNGSWYNAQQATDHLHRKYDYLLKKGMVTTTESFIELAGSRSSLSGQPYLVRCGSAQPIPSNAWFMGKLRTLRGAA